MFTTKHIVRRKEFIYIDALNMPIIQKLSKEISEKENAFKLDVSDD